MVQLMLLFRVGHLSRPHRSLAGQPPAAHWQAGSKPILLVVYVAFSEAVVQGIWHQVGWYDPPASCC